MFNNKIVHFYFREARTAIAQLRTSAGANVQNQIDCFGIGMLMFYMSFTYLIYFTS